MRSNALEEFFLVLLIILFRVTVTLSEQQCTSKNSQTDGDECADFTREWDNFDNVSGLDTGLCNIKKLPYMSNTAFLRHYAYKEPVIFVNVSDNSKFRNMSTRQALLEKYSENWITLSTANTHSYSKFKVTLKEYLNHRLGPQSLYLKGNNSLYFFGDNNHTEWKELFDEYNQPPFYLPQKTGAYSFGIGGSGTGVPFHFHGPGFSEVIHGSKRWFLYPYEKPPFFDPDETMLKWVVDSYPQLSSDKMPYECTIKPGEILYFPDRWWHATLNIKTSVFMSTFLA